MRRRASAGPRGRGRPLERSRTLLLAAAAAGLLLPATASAQTPCDSAAASPFGLGRLADPQRAAELEGAPLAGDPLRRGGAVLRASACAGNEGLAVLPFGGTAAYRSGYVFDRNDGARWAGRGLSVELIGGVAGTWGPFSATLAPQMTWQENADLTIVAARERPFAYPWHTLDWPQRFGADPFGSVGLGQSAVEAALGPLAVRLSTENLWWGPAHRYPILLSNSAPGVPHLALVTDEPLWIGVGHLRARLMWGRLDESEYFDAEPDNDHRLLTGAFADFTPWFLPGLTLGGGLFYHLPWDRPLSQAFDLFSFATREEENSRGNGLTSVIARWRHPASRFEAYVEWAREDFWLNFEDLLTEPDHSQGYVIGFGKLVAADGADVFVEGEWTSLQTHSEHRDVRGARPRFYAHGTVEQGHTHRGQLLGSAIGPGSDAQFLAATYRSERRSVGLSLERVRRDEDAYYQEKVTNYGFRGHDVEWSVGLHGVEPVGPLRLDWAGTYSRRKNRNFIGLDGGSWDFLRENNVSVEVGAWWVP